MATIDIGREEGAAVSLSRGELGPRLTQRRWAEAYLRTKCHLDPSSRLARIEMDQKLGALRLLLGERAGYPSNTMWLGLRPTFLPSGILIHSAIWLQQIWAENWEAPPPYGEGKLGLHLAQCSLGQDLPPRQVAS